MYIIAVIVHIIMAVLLVTIVLLQKGKGASMGAVFGGSSSTIFGSSGPGTFLGKMTTWIALIFMVTSLYLAYFSAHKGGSVTEGVRPVAEQPLQSQGVPPGAPAGTVPAAPPAQDAPAGQGR